MRAVGDAVPGNAAIAWQGPAPLTLVSCIMPTANRRRFVPAAIGMFLAQDYPNKELVILDDGEHAVGDLVPHRPELRYIRTRRHRSLGAKRNEGCEAARGDIILHWDDDDWYAPWRLSYQVGELVVNGADLCGLGRVFFLDDSGRRAWEYVYPEGIPTWVCGATLCYRKALWGRNRFPEVNIGEDTRFVFNARGSNIRVLERTGFFVGRIHDKNTSRKQMRDARWHPVSADAVRAMVGDLWIAGHEARNEDRPSAGTVGIAKHAHVREVLPLKLNLGCCDAPMAGSINVDVVAGPGVDALVDLRNPWPWPDDSVDHIRAWDVIEHLPDKILTMNEIWRVLGPGRTAEIVVPTTDGSGAFQDPTHTSFWNRRSFLYYEAGNPYRERFARHYGIKAKFRTLSERIDASVDGPRLTIVLSAVKP
jgi:glycosyltransferase involved in cell wall biosynthesis